MTWDRLQQLIRILAYTLGGYFLGQEVTNGELFSAAVAGLINIAALGWWLYWDKRRAPTS